MNARRAVKARGTAGGRDPEGIGTFGVETHVRKTAAVERRRSGPGRFRRPASGDAVRRRTGEAGDSMAQVIKALLGVLILLPPLPMVLAWGVALRATGDRREATLWALYVGTVFFLLADAALWQEVAGGIAGLVMTLAAAALAGGTLAAAFVRRRPSVGWARAFRIVWLAALFVFVIEYGVLFLIGVFRTWAGG
ncbi:hypothetical protein TR75_03070 [Hydrogenibacillus schlegelii]|uniref:DUF3397 domain-containing protein n=2 Tax=Hydrogenibacillus schlegelii TaxID=1484 RepID=A0A132NBD6_HYDSH|nr:hypothetical protein TR75_03070 [Hydrogenibacillus schlegelii]OAR03888.1 hypothetical protein SA87_03405 [Hydrogenibacillus schlegelii]